MAAEAPASATEYIALAEALEQLAEEQQLASNRAATKRSPEAVGLRLLVNLDKVRAGLTKR